MPWVGRADEVESWAAALETFDESAHEAADIPVHAESFSRARFRQTMSDDVLAES